MIYTIVHNHFATCFYCLLWAERKRLRAVSTNIISKSILPEIGDTRLIRPLSRCPRLMGDPCDREMIPLLLKEHKAVDTLGTLLQVRWDMWGQTTAGSG